MAEYPALVRRDFPALRQSRLLLGARTSLRRIPKVKADPSGSGCARAHPERRDDNSLGFFVITSATLFSRAWGAGGRRRIAGARRRPPFRRRRGSAGADC